MVQNAGNDARHDTHAQDSKSVGQEILVNRERMFDAFIRIAAVNVVLIVAVVVFLALTQT